MFGFDKVSVALSFSPFFMMLAIAVLIIFTIFIYRYTVPTVNNSFRILLVIIRSLVLFIFILIIFEPVFTLAKKHILSPHTFVFLDNSRSMQIKDESNRTESFKNIINSFSQINSPENYSFYTFGNNINDIAFDSLSNISMNDGATNFSKIFSSIDLKDKNLSSIVIVSDGVITEGSNPIFAAEKLNVPVFTIGVGDTTRRNDIEVRTITHNDFIYAQNSTMINALIANHGFDGNKINVSLFEDGKLVETREIELSESRSQNVTFEYTPKLPGEKKMEVVADILDGEFSKYNNKKVFYINVLDNKIKVLLISSAPSNDLSFIKSTLKLDENIEVNSITQLTANSFVEKNNRQHLIDSADVFFLIGFPSRETPAELLNSIKRRIINQNIPFLITVSQSSDMNKLNEFQTVLPFTARNLSARLQEVQVSVSSEQRNNPLLSNNSSEPISSWNSLPPVLQVQGELNARPESQVIARSKFNNIQTQTPLLLSRRAGSSSSIAVLASDIWKWKLLTASKNSNLFDRFIQNSVKWLNSSAELKRVSVRTSKKIYSIGENVEFIGQVYDESLNPISDVELKIKIRNKSKSESENEINLNSLGNGLYEGVYQVTSKGDFVFSATANLNETKLGDDKGSFNIGDVDIELLNPTANADFLSMLSNRTEGKYFSAANHSEVFDELDNIRRTASKEKIEESELDLWSNEWLLFTAIFLMGLEWFLRKRAGML